MFTEQEHEIARRQLWASVWNSVANANDCKRTETPTRYADEALIAFDARFSSKTTTKSGTLCYLLKD